MIFRISWTIFPQRISRWRTSSEIFSRISSTTMTAKNQGVMDIFKPTLGKLAFPLVLLLLSLIPSALVRVIVFETLAWPFGRLLDPFRTQDLHFLNPYGAVIVALIWGFAIY